MLHSPLQTFGRKGLQTETVWMAQLKCDRMHKKTKSPNKVSLDDC